MSWFGRGKPAEKDTRSSAKERATVKMYKEQFKPNMKRFGFLVLKDGREVYFNEGHLKKAGIASVDEGQMLYVTHEPSTKVPGKLQAVSISI